MRIRRVREANTNHKLKWVFDFTGSAATNFRLIGPISKGHYQVVPAASTYSRGEFTCEVVNAGNVSTAEIFTCQNFIEPMRLGKLFDNATFSTGYEGETATVSGIIGDAFASKIKGNTPKSNVFVPVASNVVLVISSLRGSKAWPSGSKVVASHGCSGAEVVALNAELRPVVAHGSLVPIILPRTHPHLGRSHHTHIRWHGWLGGGVGELVGIG